MDLTLSADQRALQVGLRDVLADLWRAEHLREAAAGAAPGTKDWSRIAELGVFGVTLSSALVAFGFARLTFPGRNVWFAARSRFLGPQQPADARAHLKFGRPENLFRLRRS